MTRALVTGAAGFLGSRLTALLAARGDHVRALDLPRAAWDRVSALPRVAIFHGDITDRAAVDAAMDGVAEVFHVAALYELGTRDPARMRRINVGGTANVLEAAHARWLRVVHVSTVAALGGTGESLEDESHWNTAAPGSAYEATKREAHELARRMIREGARIRIAMPATIYGAGDPSMIGRAHAWMAKGWLKVGVRPELRLAFVHVDDCADGVLRVGDRGKDGEEYILTAQTVRLAECFEAFARASGRAPPRAYVPTWLVAASGRLVRRLPDRAGPLRLLRDATAMSDGQHWAFSGGKARRELGWSPRSFDEGLADAARDYGDARPLGRSRTPKPAASRESV